LRLYDGSGDTKEIDHPIQYAMRMEWRPSSKDHPARGIGDILAEGIVHASKVWGLEDIAVHVKGLDLQGTTQGP